MGKHKEWRKIVKRERRRKVRTQKAKERDFKLFNSDDQELLKEQELLELYEIEEIEKQNNIENEKWLQAEVIAMEQWKKIVMKREMLRQKHIEQQAKLKLEWEMEKEKLEKEKERLKKIEEENRQRQETFMNNLEKFINGDSSKLPEELAVLYETKPECDVCPFFVKTGCCRFGDECSRNHKYPGISKVLLAENMFGHFGLENANSNEYDTDIMLEYEDSDTYKDFKNFFYDILPEFQKFGKVVQLKVCNNFEKHLRGNTYIEYADIHSAVAAYRALHTRWYGGKQLSLQFCQIMSWNNAICGLQSRRRCPKGRTCNFLHVFRNPMKLSYDETRQTERKERTPRSWRWSESPERTPKNVSPKRSSPKRTDRDKERYYRHRDRRRHEHSHHSRSRRERF
ncbi:U2 small nuclear ribonucleoprotein auxiliary factor 35 kDa subunit-related protein 2 [Bicyclus anynana]|uniref:U2 small nuclear ribonucleoprotein auxiliary factor 35 kDa subunit-related protein 2 n=1 Tax=Bicyclus anynana TaxID=110368 RepID=A0A6J1PA49_BICAN|nr:U2 small nuclear ribonucleoprotein auxiliary factor 35 kDa subunit-related protein 2 [Bicyclus anynana]